MKTTTTLQNIKDFGPCKSGWTKLIKNVRKSNNIAKGKTLLDTEVSYLFILDSNGIDDALWSLRTSPSLAAFIANSYAKYAAEYAAESAVKSANRAAAESAAESAKYAAKSAAYTKYAARSAKHAAESAAESVKWSAESAAYVEYDEYTEYAAESAKYAAEYAAESAEYAAESAEYAAESVNQPFDKVAIFKQALLDAANTDV